MEGLATKASMHPRDLNPPAMGAVIFGPHRAIEYVITCQSIKSRHVRDHPTISMTDENRAKAASESSIQPDDLAKTGIAALDTILGGGWTTDRVYLVEGEPGTGKTTLSLQFLLEGVAQGQRGLYVTLSETEDELRSVAASHGWSLDGIDIYELDVADNLPSGDGDYLMFEPSEIELGQTIAGVLEQVKAINPQRVAFDSLSEMRLLAQNPLRYRRQILSLKQFFVGRSCTVLMLDDLTSPDEGQQLRSICHGVLRLEHLSNEYGGERRRLRVMKYRGRQFIGGQHDFKLIRGGLEVYPRRQPMDDRPNAGPEPLPSGNADLDQLLGGGIPPGTSTLLLGPSGVGKSVTAAMYACSAAARGERAVMFLFEEATEQAIERANGLGLQLSRWVDEGMIEIVQCDPGELSPGEFAEMVRDSTRNRDDEHRVSVLVIDSLNGYVNSMPQERFLTIQMHEMLKFLNRRGVNTFLVVAQHGMLGSGMAGPIDASYLADSVLLFRYFESAGLIRQAISCVKRRSGNHERSIRELKMQDGGIIIGEPLRQFQGVLTGTPAFLGGEADLLSEG